MGDLPAKVAKVRKNLDLYWEHGSDFASPLACATEDLLVALADLPSGVNDPAINPFVI